MYTLHIIAHHIYACRIAVYIHIICSTCIDINIIYIIYYILYIIYYILYIIYYISYIIYHISYIIYYILYIIYYILYIIYHISYMIYYMLYIIYYILYINETAAYEVRCRCNCFFSLPTSSGYTASTIW